MLAGPRRPTHPARLLHTSRLVSLIRLSLVAVNLGGSCGGVRYCAGAMVELVRGRKECVAEAKGACRGRGRTYWTSEGMRRPRRSEARMAEVVMRTAATANRSCVRREVATVCAWGSSHPSTIYPVLTVRMGAMRATTVSRDTARYDVGTLMHDGSSPRQCWLSRYLFQPLPSNITSLFITGYHSRINHLLLAVDASPSA